MDNEDVAPVQVEGREIEVVEHFTYLGSVLSCSVEVMEDVKSRIAKASRAFGCLRVPMFNSFILSIATKRAVYRAALVLGQTECCAYEMSDILQQQMHADHLRSHQV